MNFDTEMDGTGRFDQAVPRYQDEACRIVWDFCNQGVYYLGFDERVNFSVLSVPGVAHPWQEAPVRTVVSEPLDGSYMLPVGDGNTMQGAQDAFSAKRTVEVFDAQGKYLFADDFAMDIDY